MGRIEKNIFENTIVFYNKYLERKDLSCISKKKYIGDIKRFIKYLDNNKITVIDKKAMNHYKIYLSSRCTYKSCNSYFISLNQYFKYLKMPSLQIKLYRVEQKQSLENVVTIEEYSKLLEYTNNNKYYRSHCIMRTLACTGIRISELKFITYESILVKKAEVTSKGKTRTVYFSEEICRKLLEYCQNETITEGIIFRTKTSNKSLDNGNIWRQLKLIAKRAGVDENKVYPHSFRHLFAKTFIEKFNTIDELADILGHSSIETTRIYTRTTGEEKRVRLNQLGL